MTKNPAPLPLLTALVALCAVLGLSVVGSAAPAAAVAGGGSTPFAVTPVPAADGSSRSYFTLDGAPGQTLTDQVVISNAGKQSETLKVSAARGTTSPNTGSAFAGAFAACSGTACWLGRLPSEVSLEPGASRTIPFTVRIPAGTAPKQYLAGITVRPAADPSPVAVGGGSGSKAQAVIINEITVGVAVTVGSQLRTDLRIQGVTGAVTGSTSLLEVKVHDQGQTFVNGTGAADCTASGHSLHFPVGVNTVLPGDSGTAQVTAAGLPAGSSDCTVSIPFGKGTAHWRGSVTVPVAKVVKRVQVAPGVYAAVPPNHVPRWAIALLVTGGVVIVALIAALIVLLLRRRRQRTVAV